MELSKKDQYRTNQHIVNQKHLTIALNKYILSISISMQYKNQSTPTFSTKCVQISVAEHYIVRNVNGHVKGTLRKVNVCHINDDRLETQYDKKK